MIPSPRRLSRPSFLQVRRLGRSHQFAEFSLQILPSPHPTAPSQFSLVTSTKFHPHAVVRNRFRRFLYSRLALLPPGFQVIFYPKPSMLKLTHDQISALVDQLLPPLFVA